MGSGSLDPTRGSKQAHRAVPPGTLTTYCLKTRAAGCNDRTDMIRQLIIASSLALLASVVDAASPQRVFLFSNDGSYTRLNLADGQSSQRSLTEFGFHEVFKVTGDSANRRVLVLASRYPTKATRDEPTKTSLVVLGDDGKLLRTINKPIEPGDAVNVLADPQGKTIALSVYNAAKKRKAVFILDAQDFKTISTVEGVFLGQHATYSYDGLRLYALADGVTPSVSQVDVSAAGRGSACTTSRDCTARVSANRPKTLVSNCARIAASSRSPGA